jgi:hypothetical protein
MSAMLANGIQLEAEGGAVPLGSPFYVPRPADGEFRTALRRGDSIVLVKGPRQVGKTSLLARGLQEARETSARVVLTDFQSLAAEQLESTESLCLALGSLLAEQLDLDVYPEEVWDPSLAPTMALTRYVSREVLPHSPLPLVWALDEVDRVFTTGYSDGIFAMFRGWHNQRALDPEAPWSDLSLAISFATEAHLFIRDLNQSPFNVGTRVTLTDFDLEEVAELNRRYGSPLRARAEVEACFALLGGHPFLTRRALHELALGAADLEALGEIEALGRGPFGEHLCRMRVLLTRDESLLEAVHGYFTSGQPLVEGAFFRLRAAGVFSGDTPASARPRCELYARYLRNTLDGAVPSG